MMGKKKGKNNDLSTDFAKKPQESRKTPAKQFTNRSGDDVKIFPDKVLITEKLETKKESVASKDEMPKEPEKKEEAPKNTEKVEPVKEPVMPKPPAKSSYVKVLIASHWAREEGLDEALFKYYDSKGAIIREEFESIRKKISLKL